MAKLKKSESEYRLPNPLIYRLSSPNYTIYHRAALGGLAATVRAWGKKQPAGITAKIDCDAVSIGWDETLSDKEFLRILLSNSFRLTEPKNGMLDKLIDLPGQQIDSDHEDLRIAIHNGISLTFLQHNKMRPSEKEPRKESLRPIDAESEINFSYKAINDYAHKRAQGLGFIEQTKNDALPATAIIPQWIVPGATTGAAALEASTEEVILLMYLMVGSAIFLLRPHTFKEKAQACLIVPNIIDLDAFSYATGFINAENQNFERFNTNSYRNRVVGGVEEAALKFLLDYKMDEFSEAADCIDGCIAVAMGKVAWDKNQVNRSIIARVRDDYDEIGIFKAAQVLGKAKVLKTKDGDEFIVPSSPIPELVAANLAAERHWAFGFKTLVSERKDFKRMNFSRGGLQKMKEAIKDEEDKIIIDVFHDAWRRIRGAMRSRANRDGLDYLRLLEVRKEKTRNEILREKTVSGLTMWFLRFCAEATEGGSLPALKRADGEIVRRFIFNPRNFERFHNLCLFALVSYPSKEIVTNDQLQTQGER